MQDTNVVLLAVASVALLANVGLSPLAAFLASVFARIASRGPQSAPWAVDAMGSGDETLSAGPVSSVR